MCANTWCLLDLAHLFRRFLNLKGWTLEDVALLYGVAAWSIGLSVVLANGVRDIGQAIVDGGSTCIWGARATRWRA